MYFYQHNEFYEKVYWLNLFFLVIYNIQFKADNFEYAKQLVNNIVKSLCGGVGRYSNRVSVVRFSADVSYY